MAGLVAGEGPVLSRGSGDGRTGLIEYDFKRVIKAITRKASFFASAALRMLLVLARSKSFVPEVAVSRITNRISPSVFDM